MIEYRIVSSLLCILLFLCCFTSCGRDLNADKPEDGTEQVSEYIEPVAVPLMTNPTSENTADTEQREMRGVWLTFSEIGQLYTEDSNQFYQTLRNGFSLLASKGINTVFFHARAFSDAFYLSDIFPWSAYLTGTQGEAPAYDPFSVAIQAAHDSGIQIHAWINPYRVSYQTDIHALSDLNPAKIMYQSGNSEDLLLTESGIYYNPASPACQKLIIDGVKEIALRYPVDGIHIDDYFYPSDVGSSDSTAYGEYLQSGGKLSLSDWRLANVNGLVSGLYNAVKAISANLQFGISPSAIRSYNYETCYADVERWCRDFGYCDYIVPQIYFGFLNNYSFPEMLAYWNSICTENTTLYIGLALYKTGTRDAYAGSETGRVEWIENQDIIKRQIQLLRQYESCRGFVFFSYSDFFDTDNSVRSEEILGIYDIMDGN